METVKKFINMNDNGDHIQNNLHNALSLEYGGLQEARITASSVEKGIDNYILV